MVRGQAAQFIVQTGSLSIDLFDYRVDLLWRFITLQCLSQRVEISQSILDCRNGLGERRVVC